MAQCTFFHCHQTATQAWPGYPKIVVMTSGKDCISQHMPLIFDGNRDLKFWARVMTGRRQHYKLQNKLTSSILAWICCLLSLKYIPLELHHGVANAAKTKDKIKMAKKYQSLVPLPV